MKSDAELIEILSGIDVIHLLEYTGVRFEDTPSGRLGLCPFHKEGPRQTLAVEKKRQSIQCLQCGFHGGVYDYLKKLFGFENGDAFEYLKKYYHENCKPLPKYKVIAFENDEIVLEIQDRTYQLTRFELKGLGNYRMNVKLEDYKGETSIAALNLANIKSRHDFIQEASSALFISPDILRADLKLIMKAVEGFQRENKKKAEEENQGPHRVHQATKTEMTRALDLLDSRDILSECLVADTEKIGFVGPLLVKGVLFLGLQSRLTDKPAPILSVASYAAGKSFGQDMMTLLFPEDLVYYYTRLTPQAFSHFEKYELRHKGLVVDEFTSIDPDTLSQLRALLSKGKTATGYSSVNKSTGRIQTLYKEVLGPMAMLSSATHAELIDEETVSRFLLLPMDETIRHNEKVIRAMIHRDTEDGILNRRETPYICRIYQAMQKCIKPYTVILPDELEKKIVFPHRFNIYKRQYLIYRAFMHSIASVRQRQRQLRHITDRQGTAFEALGVAMDDIKLAAQFIGPFMGPLTGQLSPGTEKTLRMIFSYCKQACLEKSLDYTEIKFSRRDIREYSGLNQTTVKRSFRALLDLEYITRVFGKERARHHYQLNLTEEELQGGKFKLWKD